MKLAAITTLLTLFAPLVRAQDAAHSGPAPELKRLERLIGNYTGKGTAVMEPGKPPAEWTCQSSYAWTLGNHFVAIDTAVDFGSAMPPLAFRELLGWDGERKRYVAISVGNTGEGSLDEVTFPSDDTMVQIVSKKGEHGPSAERHETTFTKDGFQFRMTILGSTGAAIEGVTGSFTRVDKLKAHAVEATAAMAPLAAPVARMNKTAGTYEVSGEMIMMPGTPVMKITGTDVYRTIFGGAVLQTSTTGKSEGSPDAYAAENFTVWNADKQCFDSFGADNMGWVGTQELRFLDDGKLVATCNVCFMGQPMAQRMLIELDGAGKITKAKAMALCGASEPYCSFQGTYKLAK
jgi:hypothetical protein